MNICFDSVKVNVELPCTEGRYTIHLRLLFFFLKLKLISCVYIELSRLLENGADSVSPCSG